jgi:hypothetical protein
VTRSLAGRPADRGSPVRPPHRANHQRADRRSQSGRAGPGDRDQASSARPCLTHGAVCRRPR